jgi:cellulose synthase/poly-beta-1,6-N-acetylglucosamine synthase-like glycosyltransferase
MNQICFVLLIALYLIPTLGLMVYGLNCYVMIVLFQRRRAAATSARLQVMSEMGDLLSRDDLPVVTTQIAIFNERHVAERIIRAVCAMRYPQARHEIQVLDDSTDDTRAVVDRVTDEMRARGYDIHVLHRRLRTGYKGGALAEGLEAARGELLAVFDADFVPPEDYLVSMVPFFLRDSRLGFAQARWGHLNHGFSVLTRAQSIGIDGHFIVEQIARGWNSLFMNFNGTAGIWRRAAIVSGGGWQWDTLTEDLDLSYRVQFEGWKALYLPDLVVPAELPETIAAFRSQQFRWAKGSFQTLIKMLPRLWQEKCSWFKKFEAVMHISGYGVHPLMLALSILALPLLLVTRHVALPAWFFGVTALPLGLSILGPSVLYVYAQCVVDRRNGWKSIYWMPVLMVVGVGLAFSNTRAIIEAIRGRQSEFVRTPKRGDNKGRLYAESFSVIALAEIALGIYGVYTVQVYMQAGRFGAVPFLMLYACGYLYMGILSIWQSIRVDRAEPSSVPD